MKRKKKKEKRKTRKERRRTKKEKGMGEFIFEKLEVYQRSLKFSIEIVKVATDFSYKYRRIRDQFIGAAISIPLNLAEANGRGSSKDKINFYRFARGSCFECIPLIDICFKLKLINQKEALEYRQEIKEITSMIYGLIRYQNKQ